MTGRERILAAMDGTGSDRPAVAPFVHISTVKAWKKDPDADVLTGTAEFCRHFGFDLIHRNFNVRHNDFQPGDGWTVTVRKETRGNETWITREIVTPGGVLRDVESLTRLTPYTTVAAKVECPIRDEADLELFQRYVPEPAIADLSGLRRAKEIVGRDGITAPWVWGVFNYMAQLRSLEALLTDPYLNPEFYHRLAGFALTRLKKALAPLLGGAGPDFVSYTGNLAGGSMAGPDYFRQYVLPYERELIQFLQAGGVRVIYHNCGDGANMIGCYNALKPDCYESMTEPPFADNSLDACLREFRPDIALMGNVDQIQFLKEATLAQVREKALEILKKTAGRRFILATSDLLEEGTPEENLLAMSAAARELGGR